MLLLDAVGTTRDIMRVTLSILYFRGCCVLRARLFLTRHQRLKASVQSWGCALLAEHGYDVMVRVGGRERDVRKSENEVDTN